MVSLSPAFGWCSSLNHKWLLLIMDALITVMAFIIIILLAAPVTLVPATPTKHENSRSIPQFASNDPDRLSNSMLLNIASFERHPPVANVNVTDAQVNGFLGLSEDALVSPRFVQIARCRMALNYQRNNGSKNYNPATCHGIDARWFTVVYAVVWLALIEFLLALICGRYPKDLSGNKKKLPCRGIQAFFVFAVWLFPVCYYYTRDSDFGVWYIEANSVQKIAYYKESLRWSTIGGMCVVCMAMKYLEVLICCCPCDFEPDVKPDEKAKAEVQVWVNDAKAAENGALREQSSSTSEPSVKSSVNATVQGQSATDKCEVVDEVSGSQKKKSKKKPSQWFRPAVCFMSTPDGENKDRKSKAGQIVVKNAGNFKVVVNPQGAAPTTTTTEAVVQSSNAASSLRSNQQSMASSSGSQPMPPNSLAKITVKGANVNVTVTGRKMV